MPKSRQRPLAKREDTLHTLTLASKLAAGQKAGVAGVLGPFFSLENVRGPMNTIARKVSELHERLAAARKFAGLSQQAVGDRMVPVRTRGTIAMWESPNDAIRTTPSAEQVMAFAQVCGVPAEMLVDDTVTPTEIELLPRDGSAVRSRTLRQRLDHRTDADVRGRAFWSNVQYEAIERKPELRHCFDVAIEAAGVAIRVPFLHRRAMAFFYAIQGEDRATFLEREIPAVLFAEAAYGRKMDKHLLVLAPAGTDAQADGLQVSDDFGCITRTYTSALTAVQALIKL